MKKILSACVLLLAACETVRTAENEIGCDLSIGSTGSVATSFQDGLPRPGQTLIHARVLRDDGARASLENRITRRIDAVGKAKGLSVMMLSTGGPWGAFGSGHLRGQLDAGAIGGDAAKFDIVTGASTGSVIAPFAFIGDAASIALANKVYLELLRDETTLTKRNVLELFSASSLYDTRRMRDLITNIVRSEGLIAKIKVGARENRTLAVSAVNIDTGLTEVFDLTAIAERLPDDPKLHAAALPPLEREFVERIMASVAIPIAFEPVFINGCMYQDSGLRQQLFMSGEFMAAVARAREPGAVRYNPNGRYGPEYEIDTKKYRASEQAGVAVDLYVLINGTANSEPELGDRGEERRLINKGLLPIASRDLEILLNQAMWASIDRTRLVADTMQWQLQYRDASGFDAWWERTRPGQPAPRGGGAFGGGTIFEPTFMTALNEYGYLLGKDSDSQEPRWTAVPGGPDIYQPPIPKPPRQ